MKVETKSRNVLAVTFDDVSGGWEQWFMLSSDRHHDSARADHKLELAHLELAKQRNAFIMDFGDLFDAMQGKNDPRSSYTDLRSDFVGRPDIFNAISEYNAEFYKPYANNFLLLTPGNHETAVAEKSGTDLTSILIDKLNTGKTDNFTHHGGYGGWVRFQFYISETQSQSFNLKYMHGWGGGGPVTRGVIDTNRQAVYLPDADIIVNGHVHEGYILSIARERLSQSGVIKTDLATFVRTPGYKNSHGDGSGGWDVIKGLPPKPRGCAWMRFYYSGNEIKVEFTLDLS